MKKEKGVFIGTDFKKEIPVIFDSFDHNENINMIVMGRTGNGFSYKIKKKFEID
ncbi:MAG: hypothetical protein N4A54_03860 [Peptostreptococcaceae bacterium]|jgi:hypothetical protein|nr:hypothetical protein [Peptostreptococcaceae bacterium]